MESMLGHVGEGGGTSGAMFGGNIGPFHAVRAVTVAKRREYRKTVVTELQEPNQLKQRQRKHTCNRDCRT